MEAENVTQKDPAVWCSVSDVAAKDIMPQNAHPGCRMGVAEERDTRRVLCQRCGGYGHKARDFRSTPRSQPALRSGRSGSKPSPPVHCVGCAVEIRNLPWSRRKRLSYWSSNLETGEQIKVMKSGACLDVDAKAKLQLVNGKVGKRCVEVFRDTGCTGVLIKRDLVNQEKLTREDGYVTTFDETLLMRAPIAKIQVDTRYYIEVEALCV